MKNKQTAVEWIKKVLEDFGDPKACRIEWNVLDEVFKQAKKIEEDQRITDYNVGYADATCRYPNDSINYVTGGDERDNRDKKEDTTTHLSTTTAILSAITSIF